MVQGKDLDMLRDIPGYKAILKALIKSQIQHLVEQLSSHTDEEAVLLAVSTSDGSLSHLGSESGRVFLDSNEDIKSKFLGFCLKRQHNIQSEESQVKSPPLHPQHSPLHTGKRRKFSPYVNPSSSPYMRKKRMQTSEMRLSQTQPTVYPVSVQLAEQSQYQEDSAMVLNTASELDNSGMAATEEYPSYEPQDGNSGQGSSKELEDSGASLGESAGSVNVKVEPESEEDLTITGVEFQVGGGMDGGQGEAEWATAADNSMAAIDDAKYTSEFTGAGTSETALNGWYAQTPTSKSGYKHQCDMCERIFLRHDYLKKHRRCHTGEKPFACTLCGARFTQKSNLNRHLKNHVKT